MVDATIGLVCIAVMLIHPEAICSLGILYCSFNVLFYSQPFVIRSIFYNMSSIFK